MLPKVISTVIGCASTLLMIPAVQAGESQPAGTATVGCEIRAEWRLGAPAMAAPAFSRSAERSPTVFLGKMCPRGMLILDPPSGVDGKKGTAKITVRSETVNIASLLTIVGAHYWGKDEKVTWVEPAKLPALKAWYDPDLPKTISWPGSDGGCVLLFQIGEGKEAEWAEGRWSVSLRFDSAPLTFALRPSGGGTQLDPGRADNSAVISKVEFLARKASSKDDLTDYWYFQYLDSRTRPADNGYRTALDALTEVIREVPNDPNLLYAKAGLLVELGQEQDALRVGQDLLTLLQGKEVRRPLQIPGEQQSTQKEAVGWLRLEMASWTAAAQRRTKQLESMLATAKAAKPDASAVLLKILTEDPDHQVKVEAVRLLGELGDAKAVESIVTMMRENWFWGELRTKTHRSLLQLNKGAKPPFEDKAVTENYPLVVAFWEQWVKEHK